MHAPRRPHVPARRLLSPPGLGLLLAVGIGLGAGLGVAGGAWAESPRRPCPAEAEPMVRRELLFGTARETGPAATEADWQRFVDGFVTPRFPDGLTHFPASGQWRGGDGAPVRERSFVLLIFHAPSPAAEAAVEEIREEWKRRFDQQSVLRVDGMACVRF